MRESLDMQIKRRDDGLVLGTVRIHADIDDAKELLDHLEQHARQMDRKDASTRWLGDYEGIVTRVSKSWLAPVVVAGLNRGA